MLLRFSCATDLGCGIIAQGMGSVCFHVVAQKRGDWDVEWGSRGSGDRFSGSLTVFFVPPTPLSVVTGTFQCRAAPQGVSASSKRISLGILRI